MSLAIWLNLLYHNVPEILQLDTEEVVSRWKKNVYEEQDGRKDVCEETSP